MLLPVMTNPYQRWDPIMNADTPPIPWTNSPAAMPNLMQLANTKSSHQQLTNSTEMGSTPHQARSLPKAGSSPPHLLHRAHYQQSPNKYVPHATNMFYFTGKSGLFLHLKTKLLNICSLPCVSRSYWENEPYNIREKH